MKMAKAERVAQHSNGFGALRLLFAAMVIVSHTPELHDGNRSREILTRLFGSISFGELAVDCFFVLSGYLIAASWLKNPHVGDYLRKRIARIFPGFIVCFAICILIVAPLGGVPDAWKIIWQNPLLPIKLDLPEVPGIFPGFPYPSLNGSMWTISYEFRCYILIMILGLSGILRAANLIVLLVLVFIVFYFIVPPDLQPLHGGIFTGYSDKTLRLTPVFLIGTLFFLNRDNIIFSRKGAVVAAAGLVATLLSPALAHFGVATFGGYLIFGAAGQTQGILTKINNRNDVSYGLYLYAWPIEKLLFLYYPSLSLLTYGFVTLMLSYVAGWASWIVVERPALKLAQRLADLPAWRQPRSIFLRR